eukprot:6993310-Ditylum_brightwellii.AAC.1
MASVQCFKILQKVSALDASAWTAKMGTFRTFVDPICTVPELLQSQSLVQPHFTKNIILETS